MTTPPRRADAAGTWRRFARVLLGTAVVVGGVLYGFIVTVDPWDVLPFSPRLPRIPISTNTRYSMPALTRGAAFDSVMLGTSTSRLMQPAVLDRALDARFLQLGMNSASAWEQARLLLLFLRHHPAPRVVMIDIDAAWCRNRPGNLTGPNRPWPEWMYDGPPWAGYLHMANLYALQEAANQFLWLVGLKAQRFGSDGYTSFVPPDDRYDRARVDRAFAGWTPPDPTPAPDGADRAVPDSMGLLRAMLSHLPEGTRRLLWFPPASAYLHGPAGSRSRMRALACRRAVTAMAAGMADTLVVDFDIPGPIVDDRDSFWDPLHYRLSVARRVMDDFGRIAHGGDGGTDAHVLVRNGWSPR
ncbi:hypothetical protein K6L44_03445 [Gluconacetobacter entanii]|uniref:hypothetical protein n=1 Tax=Gluconacetobacter entanii TaxID=108528 RepID=UPI001C9338B0|nr:hypothetical protein [Gluconacetobacter entanii]MBY4639072.1 hypothetical protein [Gluconacetobacter entanii]MCW4580715.1 hypothetical protein [Gluconacetobacter entanii]MCW4584044.1 hypothetical protein [Gluconacetobacter entanii]MCW4587363.1 hypothetical protein [Gluconacetobacter entanii]